MSRQEFCDCEAYEPCHGECCGAGNCTCSPVGTVNAPMKILDLFSGIGGAGTGYFQAGFYVVGVDVLPQSDHPFDFIQADALEVLRDRAFVSQFDAIHASPPCQAFTPLRHLRNSTTRTAEPIDLVASTRDLILATGLPYVIENVVQAPLSAPVTLCGTMFGLKLYRHRNFETNWVLAQPEHPKHVALCMRNGVLPTDERPFMTITGRNGHNSKAWVRKAAEYMEMPWAAENLNGVCEAIPPAYTRYVGKQLRSVL